MDKKLIGQKISELRKEKGLTQKELAERLCVTDKSVSKWETGVHFPDIALLENLAKELDTSISEILGLEQSTSEESIKGMVVLSEEEKKKIKGQMKSQSWEQIVYGMIGMVVAISLSWFLDKQGLKGGVHGAMMFLMIVAMHHAANGIYNLRNLRKL